MKVQRVPSSFGSFSEAVVVADGGRHVYLSGQIGVDDEMRLVPGGAGPETSAIFEGMRRTLAQLGGELSHIVKITAFLTSLDDYGAFGEARALAFEDAPPASAAVQVSGLLLGAAVEIEAVAVLPDAS